MAVMQAGSDDNTQGPRFKQGDSVIYTDGNGDREIYTIVDGRPLANDEFYYVVKERDGWLPESRMEPYEPEMEIEVDLRIYDVGDRVQVAGYGETEFEIVGIKVEHYIDGYGEYYDTLYTLKDVHTGAIMFAVEEDVKLVGIEEDGDAVEDKKPTVDDLLDCYNDHMRLYREKGSEGFRERAEQALRELRGRLEES